MHYSLYALAIFQASYPIENLMPFKKITTQNAATPLTRRQFLATSLGLGINFTPFAPLITQAHASSGLQARHRGLFEITLDGLMIGDPFHESFHCNVEFSRPDKTRVLVDAFFDGEGQLKARAYCDTLGRWQWKVQSSDPSFNGQKGTFDVISSELPGKLRQHPLDPYQFAWDNGDWFLHIGDTAYRYFAKTEPNWQAYIDQTEVSGFTKLRTWFCEGRGDVQNLFNPQRTTFNIDYWQQIDARLQYALINYPHIQFQLIPYGEDTEEIRRYAAGDALSHWIARYAQARFSAYPNVQWCISNDREIVQAPPLEGRQVLASTIDRIALDMYERESWDTLITNHQSRWSGYTFTEAKWSDITTLEDLDQVSGRLIKDYRQKAPKPVIIEEDRYEYYRPPQHPRYFFRRFIWSSLLSGGHASYGGLASYEAFDGEIKGIYGYQDAVKANKLKGADHFPYVHKFFKESGLTLVGFQPADTLTGNNPTQTKCCRKEGQFLIYLANPDQQSAEKANHRTSAAQLDIQLPEAIYEVRWFNPRNGKWLTGRNVTGHRYRTLTPGGGDWVLWLNKTG